jgi:hypothetical protein
MEKIIIEIIGWIGSVAVVAAYLLVSYNKVKSDSYFYQFLNLLGSICLIINTFYHHAFPSMIVNIIWSFIAIAVLFKTFSREKRQL